MAIPSGSGTEVLKRSSSHALSDAYATLITGVANHIYTVLNITLTEMGDAAETFYIRIDKDAAGSNQLYLINEQTIGAKQTFVWNDKIVLTGTDKLEVFNSTGNCDWYCSYIDQDYS